ncbi:hypothetical protein ACE6H2_003976 [Prunus campanulata]
MLKTKAINIKASLSLSLSRSNIKSSRLSLFGCSGGERSPFRHCGVAQETSVLSLATCHRQLYVFFCMMQRERERDGEGDKIIIKSSSSE